MLTDQRDRLGCRGDFLGDEKHEHGEREEDGQAEADLLVRGARQPEGQQGQDGEHETRHDDVEDVRVGTTTDGEYESQCRVALGGLS